MTTGEGVGEPNSAEWNGKYAVMDGAKLLYPAIPSRLTPTQKTNAHNSTIAPIIQAIQPFLDINLPTENDADAAL